MAKITLQDAVSGYASTTLLNNNADTIESHLNDKVLYRDNPSGEPNSMANDLDMNSNDILNVAGLYVQELTVGNTTIVPTEELSTVKVEETFTLTDGQLVQVFTENTVGSSFYIRGDLVDSGRLLPTTDYSVVHSTKTLTLVQSYPAGTKLSLVYLRA